MSSPLFADLGLNERLLKALDQLSLITPTPVQEAMIPVALTGRDLQVSAETGSGKTAGYLLPLLHQMHEKPAPKSLTRALILLPTRELAHQVDKHCQELSSFTQLKSGLVLGGSSYNEQKALIRKNPEIIIGTPGRILEHVQQHSLELGGLEFLVLDEADRMLDMGFRDAVMEIVRACGKQRQTMLLSATLVHTGIGRIAKEVLKDAEIVEIGTHRAEHHNIQQQRILADDPAHKNQLCNWLLSHTQFDKALIFTNTREHAQALSEFLQKQRDRQNSKSKEDSAWGKAARQSMKVGCLHGELDQLERKRIMGLFRSNGLRVLVATDIAARGLDVKGVDLVINYGVARSGDDHVHRIGRTGRAGDKGLAITLVAPSDWNNFCSIERYLKVTMDPREVEGMEAHFKGEVKYIGGKAKEKKGKDKDGDKAKNKKKEIPKSEQRHSFKKNVGKRRVPKNPELAAKGAAEKAAAKAAAMKKAAKESAAKAKSSTLLDQSGFKPVKRRKTAGPIDDD